MLEAKSNLLPSLRRLENLLACLSRRDGLSHPGVDVLSTTPCDLVAGNLRHYEQQRIRFGFPGYKLGQPRHRPIGGPVDAVLNSKRFLMEECKVFGMFSRRFHHLSFVSKDDPIQLHCFPPMEKMREISIHVC